ncbi:MAG TPA: hypothetical protein P5081_12635 [Phycisphaerae bacterium]|nr:hypothetical protein [Phycisphaerae bacterium]HRW53723.1 hypothetical protein [Phycisphaerae bacterium]
MARHTLALTLLITITPGLALTDVQSTDSPFDVYLEPVGDNTGFDAAFFDALVNEPRLGAGETLDFDDLSQWPTNTIVPSVTAAGCEVALFGNTNHAAPFVFHPTGFYHWENQMFEGTLVMGSVARLVPLQSGGRVGAIGFWIFDDGYFKDSLYRVDVTDACGNTTTEYLENGVPRVSGYEVEGFVGVVSRCGITSVTVTSLDSATGEPWDDPFEIDYLTIVRLDDPQPCPQDVSNEPPPTGDGTCTCTCRHCLRCEYNQDSDEDDGDHPNNGCGRDGNRGRHRGADRGHNGRHNGEGHSNGRHNGSRNDH